MVKSVKNWEELREYPSSKKPEISYLRHRHIDRVSVIEEDDGQFSVLVHTCANTYLHSRHETDREALQTLTSVVEGIREMGRND